MQRLILLLGLGLSSPLWAAASPYDNVDNAAKAQRALETREQNVRDRLARLNQVSAQVSRLSALRERVLLGDKGLKARSESWLKKADTWLLGWQNVQQLVLKSDAGKKDGFATDVQNRLSTLSSQIDDLLQSSGQISHDFSQYRLELEQMNPIPNGLIKNQDKRLQSFNAGRAELTDALKNAETLLATRSVSELQKRYEAVIAVMDAYMRTQLTRFPELQAAIKKTRESLQVNALFEPKVVALESQSLRVKDYTLRFALQSAKKELGLLKSQKTALSGELTQKFPGNGSAKNLLDRLTAAEGKAQDSLDGSVRSIGEGPAFVRYMKTTRQVLSKDCAKPDMQPLRDCELLRTLNALNISSATLSDYTPADMEYLENQLRLVSQGPSYARTGR